jgi:hypothetical protein
VTDEKLATQLKLAPGKFYIYSKPSILLDESRSLVMNGSNPNMEFIQAVEGACRNELTINDRQAELAQGLLVSASVA